MNIERETADKYQGLFNYLNYQYGLNLTIDGMNDLISEVDKTKQLLIPLATKSFKIEVHNNSGAWYEIVLANSYLEAKMKIEKAYPNNTHISLECEYDKPIF